LRQLLQQLVGQVAADAPVERCEVHVGEFTGHLPTLRKRRPGERQQQHRHVAVDLFQVIDEVERGVVSPMQVVELDHERQAPSTDAT
jgi:hypothetical protein